MVIVLVLLFGRNIFHLDHDVEHVDRHNGKHIRLCDREESLFCDEEPAAEQEGFNDGVEALQLPGEAGDGDKERAAK